MGRVTHIIHGTTITTNAVLTGRGAKTAFVTTAGFRDLLQMRRGIKTGNQYQYDLPQPAPLIERRRVHEVQGRIDFRGEQVAALDEEAVRRVATAISDDGIEAVGVSLLWSFANPAHEQRTAELLREALPGVYVSLSSEVIPQLRVYERSSTTALNAYVGPVLSRYLDELGGRLSEAGFAGTLLIMQSNGGAMSPEFSARFAVNTLLSGPAGGPEAGLSYGALHGIEDLITVDMGGTSFDVALVRAVPPSPPPRVRSPDTASRCPHSRFTRSAPAADRSRGSTRVACSRSDRKARGPIRDRRATDAAAPARPSPTPTCSSGISIRRCSPGATFRSTPSQRPRRCSARSGGPLGLSVEAAAQGVYTLINTTMANAVRYISVERGKDPREYALVVAGGAGPLHAGAIAAELEIPVVLVPWESSVFCAAGMIISDIKHDYVRTLTGSLEDAAAVVEEANTVLAELANEARETLRAEGVTEGEIVLAASADLHYVGQFHEVEVEGGAEALDATLLEDGFHRRHRALYGHAVPGAPLELINVRIRSVGETRKPTYQSHADAGPDPSAARKGDRTAFFDGEACETPVYDGLALRHGNLLAGPALVEQPTTTIVVRRGFVLECDEYGNYVLHRAELTLEEAFRSLGEKQSNEPIGASTMSTTTPAPLTSSAVDPILVSVVRNRLDVATKEMGQVMLRTTRSPIFSEARDFVTAIYDRRGRIIAQTSYIPVLVNATPWAIEQFAAAFADEMTEGDIYILNDPHKGNNHPPDITIAKPIIVDGKLRLLDRLQGPPRRRRRQGRGWLQPAGGERLQRGNAVRPDQAL